MSGPTAHVLFVDATQAGLHTIRRALERGFHVTFIRGLAVQFYSVDDDFRALLAKIHHVIELANTFDEDALTIAIAAIHEARPVDAVISQYDSILEPLAAACARLGLPYTSPVGVGNARDKARARGVLAENGLASARWAVAHDLACALRAGEEIGYPVVVKPVSGMDGILAAKAADANELSVAVTELLAAAADPDTPELVRRLLLRGLIVEEHLSGELVSAELGVSGERTWRFLVSGRSRASGNECVEMGAVLPANIGRNEREQCFAYAEAVCGALGLDHGIFHVELILTDSGPTLVEVNPRVMGGVMTQLYRRLTGVDFCDHLLDLHLGLEPAAVAIPTDRTIAARRIMPSRDCCLGERVDLSWLAEPEFGVVSFESFRFEPGAKVRRQEVLGRVAVMDETWAAATARADDLVELFQRNLGIPLYHATSHLENRGHE